MEENATNISIDQDETFCMDRLELASGSCMNMNVEDAGLVAGLKRSALDRSQHDSSSHSTSSWVKGGCTCAKMLKTVDGCHEEEKMKLGYEDCCPTSASERLTSPLARYATLASFQNLSITYPYLQRSQAHSPSSSSGEEFAFEDNETRMSRKAKIAEMLEQAAEFAVTLEQMQNKSHQRRFTNSDAANMRNRRRAQRRNSFVMHRKHGSLLGGNASFPELGMNRRSSYTASTGNIFDNTSPEVISPTNSASMSDLGYIHLTDEGEGNVSNTIASTLVLGCLSDLNEEGSSSMDAYRGAESSVTQVFGKADDSAFNSNMNEKPLDISTCQSSMGLRDVGIGASSPKSLGKSKISRAA